jgi:hypothetical protein
MRQISPEAVFFLGLYVLAAVVLVRSGILLGI